MQMRTLEQEVGAIEVRVDLREEIEVHQEGVEVAN